MHVVPHVIVVAPTGHFLDHATEENEAIVAVLEPTPRLERRRPIAVERDVVLQGAQLEPVRGEVRPEDVARAARVGQQLRDGHLAREILVGIVGEVFPEGVTQAHLPRLYELQDRRGREHLVH